MRAAVRKNSSLSELSALCCSFTFHREISPDSPDLSLGNDYHSKYFLISTDICRWRETENDVAGLQWVVYFLLGEGLDFRKLKLSIKKQLRRADRGLAVMERPYRFSSPFCHTLLPSSQGLLSQAERCCVGERWVLCHSSPSLTL